MGSKHLSWCGCLSSHLNVKPYFSEIRKIYGQDNLIFCVYQEALKHISLLAISARDLEKRNFIQLSFVDAQRDGISENQVHMAIFQTSIVQHLSEIVLALTWSFAIRPLRCALLNFLIEKVL